MPDSGHLIWLTFDPQAGREQAGRRPALVLSPASFNRQAGLALVCPITSRIKGYPFEVALPTGLAIAGVALADHLKSLDWLARGATFAGVAPASTMAELRAKLQPLLGFA